jgi:type IV secretory pathway VirJ component
MKRLLLLVGGLLLLPPVARAAAALPVIEVPPQAGRAGQPLLIMLTGDGGWAEFVRHLSTGLSGEGWAVAGLDLRKYLWTRRTPDEAARAVDAMIRTYAAKWQRSRVVVAGFSRGADIAACIVNRLPEPTRRSVALVVLISPGVTAEFEFHLMDYLRDARDDGQLPVLPELQRLPVPALLLYGRNDRDALKPPPDSATLRSIGFAGDHHLDFDYPGILAAIRSALSASEARVPLGTYRASREPSPHPDAGAPTHP